MLVYRVFVNWGHSVAHYGRNRFPQVVVSNVRDDSVGPLGGVVFLFVGSIPAKLLRLGFPLDLG